MEGESRRPAELLRNVGVAVAYMATALLAFLCADPTVPATAVFPPAGIALAAVLVWGWRVLAGVAVGAFVVNLGVLYNAQLALALLPPAALAITAASCLQAWVGARLCELYARNAAPADNGFNELRLILLGAMSCAIAAAVGNLVQLSVGRLALAELPYNLFTWWVGDALGIAIFTPLLLFGLQQYRRRPGQWWRAVAAPLTALVVVMLVFFLVTLREENRLESLFREQARSQAEHLNLRLARHAETLRSLHRFWKSSREVDALEFHEFVSDALSTPSDTRLLGWAAAARDGSVRLRYVEPAGLAALHGFDLNRDPALRDALAQARDSGKLIAVPGLGRLPEPQLQGSKLLLEPIYANGRAHDDVATRRAGFLGVAVLGFELRAAALYNANGLLLRISQHTGPEPRLLYATPGQPDRQPLTWSTTLAAGEHQWDMSVTSAAGYRAQHRSPEGALMLIALLFLASVLQALVLVLRRAQVWREYSQQAEQARSAAEQDAQVKGAFLATMSHEIRTPMNGVIGMTQLLAETKLDTEQQHYVGTIRRSCEALLRILNDILDYSKIEAGRLQIEHVSFDLRQLMEECCSLFSPHARQSGIPLDLEMDRELPKQVTGDPVRIRQVLINLLGNAYKFTREGRVALRVRRVRGSGAHPELRFEVQDTGIGIADVQRARLFESFSQGDSSITRKYGGTGLGLSICRLLVDLMDGQIGVNTAHGKGSLFWFNLPLKTEAGMQTPALEVAVPPMPPAPDLAVQGLRVLVVEDNPVNQQVIAGFLRRHGIAPRVVGDGVEALHVLTSERQLFDAVFMDCEMPNMDGYTATERIRQWEQAERLPPVFICGVSAHVMPEFRERALAAGMDDFVSKPIAREELERVLEILKAQHMLPQALTP
jgi:signal transduction histidine kinase/CheY-like chemotaxis protein